MLARDRLVQQRTGSRQLPARMWLPGRRGVKPVQHRVRTVEWQEERQGMLASLSCLASCPPGRQAMVLLRLKAPRQNGFQTNEIGHELRLCELC